MFLTISIKKHYFLIILQFFSELEFDDNLYLIVGKKNFFFYFNSNLHTLTW